MLILTQYKDQIINLDNVLTIEAAVIDVKTSKIFASLVNGTVEELGVYKSYKKALEIIKKILDIYGAVQQYEMPEEEDDD